MFTQTKKKVTTTNLHKEEISDYLKEEIKERDNNNGKEIQERARQAMVKVSGVESLKR